MKLENKRIVVVGDIILDEWIYGKSTRLSPELPVPVVNIDDTAIKYSLGGAANVAANVKSLGGEPLLVGVLGKEQKGFEVYRLLRERDMLQLGILHDADRKTTVKTRLLANGHQIARMDSESTDELNVDTHASILETIQRYDAIDAFIISDYAKGVVSHDLIKCMKCVAAERKIPIFIDPKTCNAGLYYGRGITAMTPNHDEAIGMLSEKYPDIESVGSTMLRTFDHECVLMTLGERGMALFGYDQNAPSMIALPTSAKHVFDVAGAGDTVIAALALAYASGNSMLESARIANLAAGIVVGKAGTATVSRKELEEIYNVTESH